MVVRHRATYGNVVQCSIGQRGATYGGSVETEIGITVRILYLSVDWLKPEPEKPAGAGSLFACFLVGSVCSPKPSIAFCGSQSAGYLICCDLVEFGPCGPITVRAITIRSDSDTLHSYFQPF